MAVYKIFPIADASIYSQYPSINGGLDEILEVSVKNATAPKEDIRRSLILFADSDITEISNLKSGNWQASLKMYLSYAENLPIPYTLNFNQVSDSWIMGTGKFLDYPETRNGVCWYSTSSYISNTNTWTNPEYYNVTGGGSWNSTICSQSFGYTDNKDINADITDIVNNWFLGDPNYGIIVKHSSSIENNPSSSVILNYYSVDTRTIFPPCLELKWDDSNYVTGSLNKINNSKFIMNVTNNPQNLKTTTKKYQFRITARDQYPTRTFTTSSVYLTNKCLPSSSYWSLQDVKTEDVIIDFDENYTKLSCDTTGNYFNLYVSSLEPERYYKILIKTVLDSGEDIIIDSDAIFKIVR